MATIGFNSLDQLDSIVLAVRALGARHAHYRVEDAQYATAGGRSTRPPGDDFTPAVSAGWSAAYELLGDTMQAAAKRGGDQAVPYGAGAEFAESERRRLNHSQYAT